MFGFFSGNTARTATNIANLHQHAVTRAKFQSKGYGVMSVTWEDTSRFKGSCWGDNITDQTLLADSKSGKVQCSVIRKPNFSDETVDVELDAFTVDVGNETGAAELTRKSLRDFLKEKGWYDERDEKGILTSTQACVVPMTDGACKFGVNLFNYQTREDDPTLAVIVASAQGTSVAPITKYNQTLYFNQNGRAHAFEARRLEDDRKERKVENLKKFELTSEEKQRNVLLCFHVPLKRQKPVVDRSAYFGSSAAAACGVQLSEECDGCADFEYVSTNSVQKCSRGAVRSRGLDAAVLRVSKDDEGEFVGLKPGVKYERDTRFPIRCVVQQYAASDTADVDDETVEYIVKRLSTPYTADRTQGSLVLDTGAKDRPTESTTAKDPVRVPPVFATPLVPSPGLAKIL